jgi:hypothetical protein
MRMHATGHFNGLKLWEVASETTRDRQFLQSQPATFFLLACRVRIRLQRLTGCTLVTFLSLRSTLRWLRDTRLGFIPCSHLLPVVNSYRPHAWQ